jgi:four helix bundle protein
MGMATEAKRPGLDTFHAFEVAIEIIGELRGLVVKVRQHDAEMAKQIVRAGSSIAANVAEGNRRVGRDRPHLFRIAAGSADEVRAHLRVAQAWGWLEGPDIEQALRLLDRELAMLFRLT